MLGWGFIVQGLPYWEDPYGTWLYDAEKNGDAVMTENHGGYPNIWNVKASAVPRYLELHPEASADDRVIVRQWDQS